MTTSARIEANRANAKRSTGPKTTQGKARSCMNALRHGLTGQVVLMPEETLAAFQAHSKIYFDHYQPQGLLEQKFVQQIAGLQWRIDRAANFETNLLALGEFEDQMKFESGDAQINSALSETETIRDMKQTFALTSVYEQRLTRLYDRAVRELKSLQSQRKLDEFRAAHLNRAEPAVEPPPAEPTPSPTNQTSSPGIGFVCSGLKSVPARKLLAPAPAIPTAPRDALSSPNTDAGSR